MCLDLFTKEAPGGSILVSDHLPQATTQSLHFGWSLTGGSTVFLWINNLVPRDLSYRSLLSERENPGNEVDELTHSKI